jgi:formate hydrogenlyase subunit 6/NADH:ubiquinone oxidoreductase subunit I
MIRPGKMIKEVLRGIFKKPATNMYPAEKLEMPDKFRGKLKFYPERCVGCKLCMRDCPTNAIIINKVGENKFECQIDLGKCIYCAQCVDVCMKKALESTRDVELASLERDKLKIVYNAENTKPEKQPEKSA